MYAVSRRRNPAAQAMRSFPAISLAPSIGPLSAHALATSHADLVIRTTIPGETFAQERLCGGCRADHCPIALESWVGSPIPVPGTVVPIPRTVARTAQFKRRGASPHLHGSLRTPASAHPGHGYRTSSIGVCRPDNWPVKRERIYCSSTSRPRPFLVCRNS